VRTEKENSLTLRDPDWGLNLVLFFNLQSDLQPITPQARGGSLALRNLLFEETSWSHPGCCLLEKETPFT
jgi:hypothetical protein